MNKKPNLSEALASKIIEEAEAQIVNENIVEIDLDKVMQEAITRIKDRTRVDCTFKGIEDNKVKFSIEGDPSSIAVFYDRYGIEGNNELQVNSIADKVKQQMTDYLKANLGEPFDIKLRSMSETTSIIFMYLDITMQSIPYKVTTTVKFYEDGEMGMRVDCIGDRDKDELWSTSVSGMDGLLSQINKLRDYYKGNRQIEGGEA